MTYLSWHRQRKSVRTWGSWWNSRVFASISLIQNTFRCHLLLKAFQFSPNPKWLIFCLSKLLFLLQALVSPTILFQWIFLSYQAAKTGAIFCHHISTSCLVFRNRRFFPSAISMRFDDFLSEYTMNERTSGKRGTSGLERQRAEQGQIFWIEARTRTKRKDQKGFFCRRSRGKPGHSIGILGRNL